LLGEANVEPEENKKYFGNRDGLDMMFNFYANQYLFYGLASGDASLLEKALDKTRTKPGLAQWAWFLRNHDEVDLGPVKQA
jgi:maltose alpha-D-glucosyltransferase/alpha-amylase